MTAMECEPEAFDPGGTPAAEDQKSVLFTYKAGLAKQLKHPDHEKTITKAACQVSKLATRALLLVKLYVLAQHEVGGVIEKTDYTFMLNALKVVGLQPTTGRTARSAIRAELTSFYKAHFAPLLPENDVPPSYEHLNGVLEYTAKDLVAALETNIKQHFVEYVESYVDIAYHKDATLALIEKLVPRKDREAEKRAVDCHLRTIKKGLLSVNEEQLLSPKKWHERIRQHRLVVQPRKDAVRYELAGVRLEVPTARLPGADVAHDGVHGMDGEEAAQRPAAAHERHPHAHHPRHWHTSEVVLQRRVQGKV
jgi:hypothetical protein